MNPNKIYVEKRDDLDLELPWVIRCPEGDCYSPALGINAAVGWPDHATAMRVAVRHAQDHWDDAEATRLVRQRVEELMAEKEEEQGFVAWAKKTLAQLGHKDA